MDNQAYILYLKKALKEAREDLRLYAILPGEQGEIAARAVEKINRVLKARKSDG